MMYTKRDNVPVPVGWTVIEFEDGSLAKVRCDKKTVERGVCYHAQADAIDEAGDTLPDPAGKPLCVSFKHSATVEQVMQYGNGDMEAGDSAVTVAVLKLVMGEPTTLIPWADEIRNGTGTNIRARVAAANVSGIADAGAVL